MIPLGLGDRKKTKDFNLDTIQFRIDRKTIKAYAKVFNVGVSNIISKWHQGQERYVHTMRWDNIIALADKLGVPPEMLVDEEHYLGRNGMTPYRLIFALARRGFTPAAVLYSHNSGEKENWYHFFKGQATGITLRQIRRACDMAGIPVGHLFTSLKRVGTSSTFSELHNSLQVLSERDAAFLAGVAKALSYRPDQQTLEKHLSELVNWRG